MVGTVATPVKEAKDGRRDMVTPTRGTRDRVSVTPVRNATPSRAATPSDRPPRASRPPPSATRSLTAVDDRMSSLGRPPSEAPSAAPERPKQVALVAQVPLQDPIRCAVSSADGKKVWTGDRSGALRIRSAQTAGPAETEHSTICLEKPGILPNCMAYTAAGGGQVWVGFSDGFVRVFSYERDELLEELLHHTGPVLAIVADGSSVYSAGQDWKINQWSADRMKQITTFSGHKNAVRCLAVAFECLISGGDDGTVRMWNASRRTMKGHTGSVLALATLTNNELWSGGEDGVICVWDPTQGALLKKLSVHKAPITCLTRMEGDALWSSDKHGVVIIWDTQGYQMVQRMSPDSADWQRNGITAACVVQRVVSWHVWTASGDGSVRIWATPALNDSEEVQSLQQRMRMMDQYKDAQAVQLESLLASQDTAALRQEVDGLRQQLAEKHELLVKGDFRVVEIAAENDALRFDAERGKAFEQECQQERQRRIDAETQASRGEAKLLVLQQECRARAAALQGAEEDKQKHRQMLEKLIEAERELEMEHARTALAEGRAADGEKANAELRAGIAELQRALEEASLARIQQSEAWHAQRAGAVRQGADLLVAATAVVAHLEMDSRSILCDLETEGFFAMHQEFLASLRDREHLLPSSPQAALPDHTTLMHANEMLAMRVQTLEATLGETQRVSAEQTTDNQSNIARVQHLEVLVEAHKKELSQTAAELAQAKCDLESMAAEVLAHNSNSQRLSDTAGARDKELMASSVQLQKFKHQLEQNITCITQLETRLKGSQEEKQDATLKLTRVAEQLEAQMAFCSELEEAVRQRDALLAEKERSRQEAQRSYEAERTAHGVLRAEAGTAGEAQARYDMLVVTHKEEKRLLVNQLGELEAELRRTREEVALMENEVVEARAQAQVVSGLGEESQTAVAEREQVKAAVAELNGTLCERDAQLEILHQQLAAKSDQLNKQTETLGEVVGELTERRRHTNELAARLEDLEIQRRSGEVLQQRQRDAQSKSDSELHNNAAKWASERAILGEALNNAQNELTALKAPYEATRMQLDTTLRELALMREDSSSEIRMLQAQLAAKNEELAKYRTDAGGLSPSSPMPFVMQEATDDVAGVRRATLHTRAMARKGVAPMMQMDHVESSYPSYDVTQSGSFSFRNLKLSKVGVETEQGKHEHAIDLTTIDMDSARPLGSGSSGRVVEVFHPPTGKHYAVKKIPISEKRQRDEVEKELLMLNKETDSGLSDQHIVGVYGAYFDVTGYILIPMERMDGSLADAINLRDEPVSEERLAAVMFQVLCGLRYLHDVRCMVHRDIKPANLLLNSQGLVKISDFGISRENATDINTFVGTQFFMSPERLKGQSYNFSADIWSLGITMLHCAMRGNPWLNMGVRERSTFFELLKLVDEGCLPELPDEYSHDARSFVTSCLHVDAQLRPSAAKLLDQEVWLQDMTEDTAQSVTKAWVARLTQHVSSALSAATSPPHTDTDLSAINSSGFHTPVSSDALNAMAELDAEINDF